MEKYSDCARMILAFFITENQKRKQKELSEFEKNALLYLTAREGYAIFGQPLFASGFFTRRGELHYCPLPDETELSSLSFKGRLAASSVYEQYGRLDPKALRALIARESWFEKYKDHPLCFLSEKQVELESMKVSGLRFLWNINLRSLTPDHFEEACSLFQL